MIKFELFENGNKLTFFDKSEALKMAQQKEQYNKVVQIIEVQSNEENLIYQTA